MSSETKKPKFEDYPIRKGLYPLTVRFGSWGDEDPHIVIYSGYPNPKDKSKYTHNNVRINNKRTWNEIKEIVDEKLIHSLKAGKPLSEKLLEKEVYENLENSKKDKQRLHKTIQAYSTLIKEYRASKVSDYEADVKDFEKSNKNAKSENQLQKFLAKHPWLLGLEYETSKPQKIGVGQRYDFYLEKYDGYADIAEIKKPGDAVFDKNGKLTRIFGNSIQQLVEYIDMAIYAGDSRSTSRKLRLNFLKPKGILIIGRTQDSEKLKNLEYYFHNIEILTYDDVLQRGKTIIKHLKHKPRKSGKQ